MDKNIINCELTPRIKDKGRDANGEYRIGWMSGNIRIKFSLEAKKNGLNNGVEVKGVSRLISKIRHREFEIIVTTSYVTEDAYKEIIEENHPIIIISAIDIVTILKKCGFKDSNEVYKWLSSNFLDN